MEDENLSSRDINESDSDEPADAEQDSLDALAVPDADVSADDNTGAIAFQDKEIDCIDCGNLFVFTIDEQEFYQEKGLTHEPKRCKPCRSARKALARKRREPQGYGLGRNQGQGRGQRRGYSRRRDPMGQQGPMGSGGAPLFKANFGPSPWDRGGGPRGGGPRGGGPRAGGYRGGNSRSGGPSPHGQPGGSTRGGGNRRTSRGPVAMHNAICSDCETQTQVPFRPNGMQPVYCRSCLPKHRNRRGPGS